MENIPGTDRPGPGDMEMADIIGIEWNERLHNTAGWAGTNVGTHSTSAANRLIGEVVQSRRRHLLGPSPG